MNLMTILVVAGAMVFGVGLFYAAWVLVRDKKNTTAVVGLAAIGPLVNALKDFIPNKEGVDAYELVTVIGRMVSKASVALADNKNVTLDDCKDDLVAAVKEELPHLGVANVDEGLLSGAASALFLLIKNYPTIVETLKKVKQP